LVLELDRKAASVTPSGVAGKDFANLADGAGHFSVIAKSEATKQSSFLAAAKESWIASLRSQ
jgi:hypothetical protein